MMFPPHSSLLVTLLLLIAVLSPSVVDAEKNSLVVLSEAQCPDCARLLDGPLRKVFEDKELVRQLDYEFVPWGNAYVRTSGCHSSDSFNKDDMHCWVKTCQEDPTKCFDGEQVCQHGKSECIGNTVQACVIKHHPAPETYMPFLSCFEGSHLSDLSHGAKCAQKHKIDWLASQICFNGESAERIALNKQNALRTVELGGVNKLGTPWVILNGDVVDNPEKNLIPLLCSKMLRKKGIRGESSPLCQSVVSVQE